MKTRKKTKYATQVRILSAKTVYIAVAATIAVAVGIIGYVSFQYISVILPPGTTKVPLLGYWDLNENAGSKIKNAANNQLGTVYDRSNASNALWFAGGVKGSALKFNDFRSYAELASNFSDVTNGQVTVSYWIYLTNEPAQMTGILYPTLIDKYSVKSDGLTRDKTVFWQHFSNNSAYPDKANKLIVKWVDTLNVHHDGLNDPLSNVSLTIFDAAHNNLNKWHHIAWVFDGLYTKLYVNGSLESSINIAGKFIMAAPGKLTASSFTYPFNGGIIDEIKVYGLGLTEAQIQTIYAGRDCGALDPFSSECLNACNKSNDANKTEKLQCIKNACKNKFGINSRLADFCGDEKRVNFNPFDAMYKINLYCNNTPEAADCLTAASTLWAEKYNYVTKYCEKKFGPMAGILPDQAAGAISAFNCQLAAKKMYHPANVYDHCGAYILNPVAANVSACARYLFETSENMSETQYQNLVLNLFWPEYMQSQPVLNLAAAGAKAISTTDPSSLSGYDNAADIGHCVESNAAMMCEYVASDVPRSDCGARTSYYKKIFCPGVAGCCDSYTSGGTGINTSYIMSNPKLGPDAPEGADLVHLLSCCLANKACEGGSTQAQEQIAACKCSKTSCISTTGKPGAKTEAEEDAQMKQTFKAIEGFHGSTQGGQCSTLENNAVCWGHDRTGDPSLPTNAIVPINSSATCDTLSGTYVLAPRTCEEYLNSDFSWAKNAAKNKFKCTSGNTGLTFDDLPTAMKKAMVWLVYNAGPSNFECGIAGTCSNPQYNKLKDIIDAVCSCQYGNSSSAAASAARAYRNNNAFVGIFTQANQCE